MLRRGFTLVELLAVIGIAAILMAMLTPSLRKARLACQQAVCASNLRQIGAGLMMYVNDNRGHLPMIVEPLWKADGSLDFTADPFDRATSPMSLATVLHQYLKQDRVFACPSATLGYPRPRMAMNYRVSSANNFDGQIRTEEQLFNADGSPQYAYSLKYLNGRKHRLLYVDGHSLPFRLAHGVGPFYLLRDFVARDPDGQFRAPHRRNYNQLRLDMSVWLEKESNTGFTYP